ncbi:MAG: hypothetical protein OEW73_02820 [Gammaproteobacteria bacterium]|nr:hypothetical protein [Gammaproteobacteria bacterium]MDH5239699.1 hypothetical protein [Gammaproteobacteria bacterium]MDH5261557.1 hypothetical protein [Gammaproteobacteria bacterium]MDH5582277.1 hypothetical protein [Gammaproteobacteria bacterium]
MDNAIKYTLWRLLPVVLVAIAAAAWFNDVQQGGPYVLRNLVPLAIMVLLAALVLHRGGGRWSGSGGRLPLGLVGYAIPALGLALYLHYAYAINLNGMFTDAAHPERLFQYLPIYTSGAGGIGFAIGWIAGRNV